MKPGRSPQWPSPTRANACPRWTSPAPVDALLEVPVGALDGIEPGTHVPVLEDQP